MSETKPSTLKIISVTLLLILSAVMYLSTGWSIITFLFIMLAISAAIHNPTKNGKTQKTVSIVAILLGLFVIGGYILLATLLN